MVLDGQKVRKGEQREFTDGCKSNGKTISLPTLLGNKKLQYPCDAIYLLHIISISYQKKAKFSVRAHFGVHVTQNV